MSRLYATVQQGNDEFVHYFETPDSGFQSIDVLPGIVRRQYGRDAIVVGIGAEGSNAKAWEPPSPPAGFKELNVKKVKFAFGRTNSKIKKFTPKDDDFEE